VKDCPQSHLYGFSLVSEVSTHSLSVGQTYHCVGEELHLEVNGSGRTNGCVYAAGDVQICET
jgi:hypothetical protein